jgi:hypothetical protein
MKEVKVIKSCAGTVTLGAYVRGWKAVKAAAPGTMFKRSLCGWWPASREEILKQFSEGVNDRINKRKEKSK